MNHPPFPPPVLLSGLLHPRPQWPASRTEQHRPGTSGRPSLGRPASALPGLWPKNCSRAGFRAGFRAEAPGRRPCYPTHSPSAPPKLKARHPIPPPTGVRKAQGLARSRRVYCVQSLIFTDGNCGPERQRSLPGSHEEGAPPGPDAGPADPSPRCALPGTATGESWEEARAVSKSSLSVEPSPRPLTAEVTTAPQAGAGAPAPTPERSPGAPARPCGEGGGGVRRDGHTHRDPETLEGVGPRWGPQEGETWSHSLKVSGRGKLLWAGSLALWCPASPRAHTLSRGKGGPGSRPPGPFRREGTKQKVEESGGRARGPSFAHLALQRHGGSRSESARRGSRHCCGLHGILAPWPHPLLRPRPAPPKPRPTGAPEPGPTAGSRRQLRSEGRR
ncbi:uncharacterized protein LOC111143687 [Enhydra lutris kenyoni]|uniref:Uncharacterized protein LOC111143687 n=1 Tax=Enhydra lutris kenyoni TaxID=391180 RepID=A0A2Y9IX79_ENHLU|nr:uncharacterized protein LOC111143687 [Enhydra lutris kenyoni]